MLKNIKSETINSRPSGGYLEHKNTFQPTSQPEKAAKLTMKDFRHIKDLGSGSYGEVTLVKRKDDPDGRYSAIKSMNKQT